MTTLFDGIEIFFDAIKEKCSDEEDYAAEILKARGFLLEESALILSDNSHRDDAAYLNELLAEENLGEVKDGKIFLSPNANVEKIFYSKNISGCESFSPVESWEKFLHDSFAPKVPLRLLEPFVGRYIKAISACGVATCGSCDGNHRGRRRILIEFVDEPHRVWHEIIRKKLLIEKFNLRWNREHNAVEFDETDKWKTYAEFNRAAEFLYDNRIKIRRIRRAASDSISHKMARNFSMEGLKIFSERAEKLLDEL